MKKFLSLVLALVMTMSLVTISAGAKDFTDDDKVTYEEAVNVISEIGVVDGYTDGSFNPQGSLTRGAAAKIICNMILGPTTAAELHADTAPYKDVPTNHTFAGYIAYCAKEGIISGYADGTFRPAGTLTGYAFMKMLLGALGYDASIEGYTGANWSINVAKQALAIGLNKSLEGDFNGIKAVNREEAALYAFNTLKADMVEYDTTINTTINGQTVTIGNSKAKAMEWLNSASRQKNIKDDKYIQFAEQYFTKLYLTEDVDVFGRPDREWEYDGKDIGTYVNYDLLVEEYTAKVTGKDLYDLLGKSTIEDYETTVYIDGVSDSKVDANVFEAADMNKNNKEKVGATGDGVLTQVFVDTDDKEVTIAIINTYLAIADSDYNTKKEEASFNIYGLDKKTVSGGFEYVKTLTDNKEDVVKGVKASIDDFDVEDVAEDDAYLVNVADGEIQILTKAEVVEDTEISAFKVGSNVTAAGTKYNYADAAEYDFEVLDQYTDTKINLKDVTYNIYLDLYDNLIGIELVEDADNYVFITGVDDGYSNLSTKNITAAAIFTDGTMETITVNTTKSDLGITSATDLALVNSWYTYTVNNDGVYTVKKVKSVNEAATNVPGGSTNSSKVAQYADANRTSVIDKKNIFLEGGGTSTFNKVYGNDSTVYLTASIKEVRTDYVPSATPAATSAIIIDEVDSVTTGIKNANIEPWIHVAGESDPCEIDKADADLTPDAVTNSRYSSGVYTLYKDNGYVIAAVVVGEDAAASKNLVYAHTKDVEMESYDKTTDEWTWTRKVISNGEEIEITEKGDALTYLDRMNRFNWYQVKYNGNGEVIDVIPVATALTLNNEWVSNITDLYTTINTGKDTILYTQDFPVIGQPADQPTMKGNTLYVTSTIAANNGFYVDEDAKIVLLQYNKNSLDTSYYTGSDELESIIDTLNEKNVGGYEYQISAIIENGIATTVVVYDKTNNYERPVTNKDTDVKFNARNEATIEYYGVANRPTEDEAIDMIEAELERQGYTIDKRTYTSGTYSWDVTDSRGFTVSPAFTFDPSNGRVQLYKVTLTKSTGNATTLDPWTLSDSVVYLANGADTTVTLSGTTGDWSGSTTVVSDNDKVTVTKDSVSTDTHSVTIKITLNAVADQSVKLSGSWEH
nr:S-layer homology domain-containing protein [uncultured Dysosmobacter sp.]